MIENVIVCKLRWKNTAGTATQHLSAKSGVREDLMACTNLPINVKTYPHSLRRCCQLRVALALRTGKQGDQMLFFGGGIAQNVTKPTF
jgi:hypothetical protein